VLAQEEHPIPLTDRTKEEHDDVTLQSALVFADGFEYGDTSVWSNTVP
jgi:hypothetical protein